MVVSLMAGLLLCGLYLYMRHRATVRCPKCGSSNTVRQDIPWETYRRSATVDFVCQACQHGFQVPALKKQPV